MPLYEYECDACGHRFEVIVKFSDAPLETCPTCGGPVHKLMSSPAIQFKGSGFYITDYARSGKEAKDSKDPKEGTQSKEAKDAKATMDAKDAKDTKDSKESRTEKTAASESSTSSSKSSTESKPAATPSAKKDA